MILCIVLILLFLLSGRNKGLPYLHEKQNCCTILKYAAAIMIVVYHLTNFYPINDFLAAECAWGHLGVAMFFFLSGYGLYHGLMTKGIAYLGLGFIKKRGLKIIIPVLTAYMIYITVYLLSGNQFSPYDDIICNFFSGKPFLPYSWYVSQILILYTLFFVVSSIRPFGGGKLLGLLIAFAVYYVLLYILGMPGHFKASSFCFIIGLIYRKYENAISQTILMRERILFVLFIILFTISYNWIRIVSNYTSDIKILYGVLPSILASLSFIVIFVILLLHLPEIKKVPKLALTSYEVYLIQGTMMLAISSFWETNLLYYMITIIGCVVGGDILYLINKTILRRFK